MATDIPVHEVVADFNRVRQAVLPQARVLIFVEAHYRYIRARWREAVSNGLDAMKVFERVHRAYAHYCQNKELWPKDHDALKYFDQWVYRPGRFWKYYGWEFKDGLQREDFSRPPQV